MASFQLRYPKFKGSLVAARINGTITILAARKRKHLPRHGASDRGNHGQPDSYTVQAWPRPRGRKNLQPIQRQQIHLWDMVMLAIKQADILDVMQATDDTLGTAYYVRDILAMIAFGSYVSWPGFGPYPDGGPAGPTPLPREGRAARRDLALANPQKVNVVTTTTNEDVGGNPGKTFTLAFSATNPLLLAWDRDPIRIEVPVKRMRKKKNHGKKPFFNDRPVFAAADHGGGTSWSFQMPAKGPNGGPVTWYALAQLGSDSKTGVSFSTTARKVKLISVIVDLLYSPNISEMNRQNFDLFFENAEPGDLASAQGWPNGNLMAVDYDDFVHGRAPNGDFTRQTVLINLGDNAPAYPFPRQYFFNGSNHQLPDGQWSFGLNLQTLAITGPGGIRVRVYTGASDYRVTLGYVTGAVGGTIKSDQSRTIDSPSIGERHVTWIVGEAGIIDQLVEDLP